MSLLCALFYNTQQQPQLFGTEISGFHNIFIRFFLYIQNYGSCRLIIVEDIKKIDQTGLII